MEKLIIDYIDSNQFELPPVPQEPRRLSPAVQLPGRSNLCEP